MWAARQALCITFLLWLAAVTSSHVELEFLSEPVSRLVKISESRAVFKCNANPPHAEIRWLYKGLPVSYSTRWIRVSHHKLTVLLGRLDKNPKSSHILDNAYFQCEVRFRGQVLVSAPAKLKVAVLDQFPAQPDSHVAAILGNTAVIPCDPPFSVPTVVTEFTFKENIIDTSTERQKIMPSGDLQILNVTYDDSGEYGCTANNPYLNKKVTAKRKVILHVEEATNNIPATFLKTPNPKIAAALGSNVTIECVAVGNPTPVVTWRKHEGKLPHSRHHQVGGNLLLISLRRGDEGIYYCEAENPVGPQVFKSTVVEVQETPQILKAPKSVIVNIGDNFTLSCVTGGHPKPALMWFHNGRAITTALHNKRSPLVIENANPKHAGIYQCFATNDLGTVYESAVVTVIQGNKSANSDYDDDYDDDEDTAVAPPSHTHHGKHKDFDNDMGDFDKDPGFDRDYTGKRPHKKKHTKGVKLVPPSKPYITRLSNTSVMVRWNVPRNDGLPILFFKVQYKELGKKQNYWITIDEDIAAHIHSYAVTDLRPGGTYRFQIAAVYSNNDNKSGPISSKFVLLNEPPMEKPPNAPIITFAEAASPTAVMLHWEYENPKSIPVEGFFIHYRATHTAGKYLKITVLGAKVRAHEISHLLPDTGYDMKMQCFNNAGTSDFSNIFTSKTKPAEVLPGARSRSKAHQSDEADILMTENVSSKNAESNSSLYIVIAVVFGVVILIVLICTVIFFRQKKRAQSACDNEESDREEEPTKIENEYVTGNGYVAVRNKLNINVNPLSHADVEDAEKPDEMYEDIVSNNNQIIRLQTFNVNADHAADPLLNGSEINESEFGGCNEQTDAVIVSCNSELNTEMA